jgi:hypothetical protein
MRKEPPPTATSKAEISLNHVLNELSGLRKRVEVLEKEVYPFGMDEALPPPKKARLGRPSKLETPEVLRRRASLTTWLEQNWPRLAVALRSAEQSKNPSRAIAAFIAAKRDGVPGVSQPPFYDMPEDFVEALGKFLESGRFHGNPRTMAAAMAGLPEMGWKRSFDICSAQPYKTGYALQAYRDYMKRNFPDRLRELDKAGTEEEIKTVLTRSRSQDPVYLHLKENPGKVKEWLEAGKPIELNPHSGH